MQLAQKYNCSIKTIQRRLGKVKIEKNDKESRKVIILMDTTQYSYKLFYLGGRFITRATNLLYAQKLTDVPTCYKMFKADLIRAIHLNSKSFEFYSEITAKNSILGHKIPEVPVHYSPRIIKEGKKIKWTDGVIA